MTAKICHWPQQLFNTNCKVFPGRMLIENFFFSGLKKKSYLKTLSIILLVSCNGQIWKWLFSDISGICEHKKTPKDDLKWFWDVFAISLLFCGEVGNVLIAGLFSFVVELILMVFTIFVKFYISFIVITSASMIHVWSLDCIFFHDIFLSLFIFFFHHLANHWDWLSNYTEWLVQNLIYAPYVIHNKSEFKQKNLNINLE